MYRRNRATALVRASVETLTGYELAARKGVECRLGTTSSSIIKIAFWGWLSCEGEAEVWNDPDEEVIAVASSISTGSTARMFSLIDCTDSLVEGDDVTATSGPRLANDRDLPIVHSI